MARRAVSLVGALVGGSLLLAACGQQTNPSSAVNSSTQEPVRSSTQEPSSVGVEDLPYRSTSAPWWDQEPWCGLGGEYEGTEAIGLPLESPGVYESVAAFAEQELSGPVWEDYLPVLLDYLETAEPDEVVDIELPDANAVHYRSGPGGATISGYAWADGLFSASSFGFPLPCTIFEMEATYPERDRFLSIQIDEAPGEDGSLTITLPAGAAKLANSNLKVYALISSDEGYDHVATLAPSSDSTADLTWYQAGTAKTGRSEQKFPESSTVPLPPDLSGGSYLTCLDTLQFPNTVCGEFTIDRG